MTNTLVVIINSLKAPKIKKILLYEMKFLVPNYSCLQNPWLWGYRLQNPSSPSSVLNWICWNTPASPPNKIPGYATVWHGQRVHRIMSPMASLVVPYFSINGMICRKKIMGHKISVLIFSYRLLSEPFLILRTIQWGVIINVGLYSSSRNVPDILLILYSNLYCPYRFPKFPPIHICVV